MNYNDIDQIVKSLKRQAKKASTEHQGPGAGVVSKELSFAVDEINLRKLQAYHQKRYPK